MLSQGWSLSGFTLGFAAETGGGAPSESSKAAAEDLDIENGCQIVNSTLQSGRYPAITVKAGIPVKWIINAPQGSVNGCNNRMYINEYGVEHQFKTGENIIEFTPSKAGRFTYSCWMGMIQSSITVVEADGQADPQAPSGAPSAPGSGYAQNGSGSPAPYDTQDEPYEDGDGGGYAAAEYADPVPANVAIKTDSLGVAEFGTIESNGGEFPIQRVSMDLTDEGYSPAVIVVQSGTDVEWTINNSSTSAESSVMLVPYYNTRLELSPGENPLYLLPDEYFSFSDGAGEFYGYVKVVEDLSNIDEDEIKAEAAAFETMIYPPEVYAEGGPPKCH
jgi:plastocyanin domain-containing protein